MRVLQVVHSLPFLSQAGTEIHAHGLCLGLCKRHEVYVFARTCDKKQEEYEVTEQKIDGVTVYLINNTFRYCDSFEKYYQNDEIDKRFAELLDQVKPDVVHIQHLVFLSIGLIEKIKERGIPVCFTLHDWWLMCPRWHILKKALRPCEKVFTHNFSEECLDCIPELLNIKKGAKQLYLSSRHLLPTFLLKGLRKVYLVYAKKTSNSNANIDKLKERDRRVRVLLNDIDLFVAPSRYMRDRFIAFGIPPEKIRFSQNGLDDSLFKDIKKTKSEKIRFGFIGTILPAKGVHILIEAFNKIRGKDAELKIYGSLRSYTGFEDYPNYIKRIAKNKNIRFMGEFDHSDIPKIFKEMDVLVISSIWYENSPLVIKEAFLSRTPVIASRIGGIPELVTDGVNGLLFNPGDVEDLQKKVQYAIDNPEIIDRLTKNTPAVKGVEENALEIERVYKRLIINRNTLMPEEIRC